MKKKINFRDAQGLKQGPWEIHSKGHLLWKGFFINNKRTGYAEEYWHTGHLMFKGYFLDDKRTGYWEQGYSNGSLRGKGSYLNGNETGTWNLYDMEGTLIKVTYHH